MQHRLFLGLFAVFFALVLGFAVPAAATGGGQMRDDGIHMESWMKTEGHDMAKALAAAQAAGKHLLVVVEAPGCHNCGEMHADHFSKKDYADYMTKHFEVLLMNRIGARKVVDFDGKTITEADFAAAQGVRGTPWLMFFNADAKQYFTIPGLTQALHFRAFIDYVADGSALKNVDLNDWWAKNEARLRAEHGA